MGNISIFSSDPSVNYINSTKSIVTFENNLSYNSYILNYHNFSDFSLHLKGKSNGFFAMYVGNLYFKIVPYWGGQIVFQNTNQTNKSMSYSLFYNPDLFIDGLNLSLYFIHNYVILSFNNNILASLNTGASNTASFMIVKQNSSISNLVYNKMVNISNINCNSKPITKTYLLLFKQTVNYGISPYLVINQTYATINQMRQFTFPEFIHLKTTIYSNERISIFHKEQLYRGVVIVNVPDILPYKVKDAKIDALNSGFSLTLIIDENLSPIALEPYSFAYSLDFIYSFGLLSTFLCYLVAISLSFYFSRKIG